MSVCKQCATGGQPINVWRVGHWVSVEATDPVILIINGDKQNVRFFRRTCLDAHRKQIKCSNKKQGERSH